MIKQIFLTTLALPIAFVGSTTTWAQTSNQTSNIGNNSAGNTVQQSNPQNNQTNNQQVNFPNIYPLNPVIQNPVNTENDLGVNFGAGVNTLDSRNITIYLGITYQPGRTDDHNARMARLRSETQLLEIEKQSAQTRLDLLKKQVAEQELRLQKLQKGENIPPSPSN
jgi:hypothetical protein